MKTPHNATKWLASASFVLSFAACSSERVPPRDPSDSQAAVSPTSTAPAGGARDDRETTIAVSEELGRECQMPDAPQEAPKFDYDQAVLRPRGRNILDEVATCLSTGPLKGRAITIVGRTDPRGTEAHNQQLSASRAHAARSYLINRGVPADQLEVAARGEQDARGNDEETWALDRRVDLQLGASAASATNPAASNVNASPSPIIEGTKLQVRSAEAKAADSKASPYADQAEGGKASGKASGSSGPGTDSGSGARSEGGAAK